RRDNRVVETTKSCCPVGELGGEGSVAAVNALVPQLFRQLEIGVGAVGDSSQNGVCRQPGGVCGARPVCGACHGTLEVAMFAHGSLPTGGVAPRLLRAVG